MKFSKIAGFAAAALFGSVVSAQADTLSIIGAECASDASNSIPNLPSAALSCGGTSGIVNGQNVNRTLSGNVNLGAADGQFYSLGVNSGPGVTGGAIVFEIAPAFVGTAMFMEVTNPSNHFEAADVYFGTSADIFAATFIGTVDNGAAYTTTANDTLEVTGGPWTHLFMLDVSRRVYGSTASGDGYDLDAISLTPAAVVPLPAGIVLLGSALMGLGMRRRRKA